MKLNKNPDKKGVGGKEEPLKEVQTIEQGLYSLTNRYCQDLISMKVVTSTGEVHELTAEDIAQIEEFYADRWEKENQILKGDE